MIWRIIIFTGLILMLMTTSALAEGGPYNFVNQKDIYTYNDYTVQHVRGLMLNIEVKDIRPEVERKGGLLEEQAVDGYFSRPMDSMVREILIREMQKTGMMTLAQANSETMDYRITLEILSLYGGVQEKADDEDGAVRRWFIPKVAKGSASIRVIIRDRYGRDYMNVVYNTSAEQEQARMSNYAKGSIRTLGVALKEVFYQLQSDIDAKQLPKNPSASGSQKLLKR